MCIPPSDPRTMGGERGLLPHNASALVVPKAFPFRGDCPRLSSSTYRGSPPLASETQVMVRSLEVLNHPPRSQSQRRHTSLWKLVICGRSRPDRLLENEGGRRCDTSSVPPGGVGNMLRLQSCIDGNHIEELYGCETHDENDSSPKECPKPWITKASTRVLAGSVPFGRFLQLNHSTVIELLAKTNLWSSEERTQERAASR